MSDKLNPSHRFYPIPLTGKNPPPGWKLVERRQDGACWDNIKKQMRVICSISKEFDGKSWMHLSISHKKRIPTYDDLAYLKRNWAGEDITCIMVFPKKKDHVNIHPRCLHLFCCLDGDAPFPDFMRGSGSI